MIAVFRNVFILLLCFIINTFLFMSRTLQAKSALKTNIWRNHHARGACVEGDLNPGIQSRKSNYNQRQPCRFLQRTSGYGSSSPFSCTCSFLGHIPLEGWGAYTSSVNREHCSFSHNWWPSSVCAYLLSSCLLELHKTCASPWSAGCAE